MLLREVNKTPPFIDPSCRPSSSRSPGLCLITNINIAAARHGRAARRRPPDGQQGGRCHEEGGATCKDSRIVFKEQLC